MKVTQKNQIVKNAFHGKNIVRHIYYQYFDKNNSMLFCPTLIELGYCSFTLYFIYSKESIVLDTTL